MKTLRAVHTIVMTIEPGKPGDRAKGIRPTKPVTKAVQPRTLFKAQNAEQEKELLDQGAAIVYADEEPDEAPAPAKGKAKAAAKAKPTKVEDPAADTDLDADADDDEDGTELV